MKYKACNGKNILLNKCGNLEKRVGKFLLYKETEI